ncbi:MAG TPA: cation diffusion facilitator family transporter [Rhodanobacteraceae bacterium]|nr:cation diffusion facilitator family transporter [Rhodanobacteraceae bacterium]
MARSESTPVVVIALIGNLCITVSKFGAAALTGSAAMASEGVHSLADTTNELLLLYGLHRANAPPDRRHPFGHGREAYFWSFIVALLILIVGASVSFYQGASRLRNPQPLTHMTAIYVVLAISFAFEGVSWWSALTRIRKTKGSLGYYAAFRVSKDPGVFTVLLEDSAALLGLVAALVGTALTHATGRPEFDAGASIAIALLLCATSYLLARETKALLIGEPARSELQQSILDIAGKESCIVRTNGVVTVQLGPDQVFAGLSTEFRDNLTTTEIEAYIERVEAAIRDCHPEVVALYVKPQTHEVWEEKRKNLLGAD